MVEQSTDRLEVIKCRQSNYTTLHEKEAVHIQLFRVIKLIAWLNRSQVRRIQGSNRTQGACLARFLYTKLFRHLHRVLRTFLTKWDVSMHVWVFFLINWQAHSQIEAELPAHLFRYELFGTVFLHKVFSDSNLPWKLSCRWQEDFCWVIARKSQPSTSTFQVKHWIENDTIVDLLHCVLTSNLFSQDKV